MKLHIFTPGDFIIRKGEIAREMYVISDGMAEVVRYEIFVYPVP